MDEENKNTGNIDIATDAEKTAGPSQPLVPSLETFKDDIAFAIKNERLSAVKMAATEANYRARKPLPENFGKKPGIGTRNIIMIIASAVLILAGGSTTAYFLFFQKPTPNLNSQNKQTLIVVDSEKQIPLTQTGRPEVMQALINERDKYPQPLSTIASVELGTTVSVADQTEIFQPMSTAFLIDALAPHASESMSRSFGTERVLGFHMLTNKEPFLLLSVTSYDVAYADMLHWEKRIVDDLGPLFIRKSPATTASSTAISTENYFDDTIIDNRDARVLRDQNGAPKIIYSFPDRKTLVITTNETTLKNLFDRLRTGALTR